MGFPVAGHEDGRTVTPREILYGGRAELKTAGITIAGSGATPKALDGGNTYTYDLREGWAMGQITASGLWTPCKRTQVNGTAGSVTSAVVDNSYAFQVGDVVDINGDQVTLTAVTYSTHTLTWSGAVTVADNEAVICTDGSAICRGFLYDWTRLRDARNENAANKHATLVTSGALNQAYLLGDIAAIIATKSSHFLGQIQIWNNDVQVL